MDFPGYFQNSFDIKSSQEPDEQYDGEYIIWEDDGKFLMKTDKNICQPMPMEKANNITSFLRFEENEEPAYAMLGIKNIWEPAYYV